MRPDSTGVALGKGCGNMPQGAAKTFPYNPPGITHSQFMEILQ